MLHDQFKEKLETRYGDARELDAGDVFMSAAGASFLGLFWFLALPFIVAYGLRHRRLLRADEEADRVTDELTHARQLRLQLKQARKELARETTATERWHES